MALTFGSLFSGIGGFDLAFERAGMRCAWQVEIDEKAAAVLAHHWPDVPRYEDVRNVGKDTLEPVDVICGGFPCQDLSVAGRRTGLAGERSGLWFQFHRILDELKPRWAVIENVPGLLSSNDGRDFAVILRGLGELGYYAAWRVLDAQYFGVAQRRRRVFIVASLGNGSCAEILFERDGRAWDSAPCREAGARLATDVAASLRNAGNGARGWTGDNEQGLVAQTLNSGGDNGGFRTEPGAHLVAHTLKAEGADASEDGTGRGVPFVAGSFEQNSMDGRGTLGWKEGDEALRPVKPQADHQFIAFQPRYYTRDNKTGGAPDDVADITNAAKAGDSAPVIAFDTTQVTSPGNYSNPQPGDPCHPLAEGAHPPAVAYGLSENQRAELRLTDISRQITSGGGKPGQGYPATLTNFGVRRLTPTECERLQGFPNGWAAGQADSARYRQLGNAVCVPVVEWIGKRIAATAKT